MKWDAQTLTDLATAYWRSATLSAAVELGVFEALDDATLSAGELAHRTGASAWHLHALLDALVGMELLTKEGHRFCIESSAASLLTPSAGGDLLDALRLNADLYPLWGRLAEAVREGRALIPPAAHLGSDPARTRRFVAGMRSRAIALAPAVVSAMDVRDVQHLLDVGAGPGTFSWLLTQRNPRLRVTLFDLPAVLDVAEELLADHPVTERVTFHRGDYRRDALPVGFDAVLYSGALHQETPESARVVLTKIRHALCPGGRLFVVDMMLGDDGCSPAFSALFSLNMMLTSSGGRVYPASTVCQTLSEVGFTSPAVVEVPNSPYWMVHAVAAH